MLYGSIDYPSRDCNKYEAKVLLAWLCRFHKGDEVHFLRENLARRLLLVGSGGAKAGVSNDVVCARKLWCRDLGTRPECRQRVFVRTGKTLWK